MTATWGTVPTADLSAWEQAEQKAVEKDQQRQRNIEAGMTALGVVQSGLKDANGTVVAFVYEQRRSVQSGLPVALVKQATAAVDRASQTVKALVRKDAETIAWCARHRVEGQDAQTKIVLERAELSTAALEADRDAAKALYALGEAYTAIRQARAAKDALPGRRDAENRRHDQVLATIERDGQTADAILLYWGVA